MQLLVPNDPGSIPQPLPCGVTLLQCQFLSFPPFFLLCLSCYSSSIVSESPRFAAAPFDLCQPQLIKSDTSSHEACWARHAFPRTFFVTKFTIWNHYTTCFSYFHTHMVLPVKSDHHSTGLDNTIHPASSPWQQISSLSETDRHTHTHTAAFWHTEGFDSPSICLDNILAIHLLSSVCWWSFLFCLQHNNYTLLITAWAARPAPTLSHAFWEGLQASICH